jgi:hypothetical protein
MAATFPSSHAGPKEPTMPHLIIFTMFLVLTLMVSCVLL